MKKSIILFMSIFLIFFQTGIFAQEEEQEFDDSAETGHLSLYAVKQQTSSGKEIELSEETFYMVLNDDGTGLLVNQDFISKVIWDIYEDGSIQISDRLGYTYDGIVQDYLILEAQDSIYYLVEGYDAPIISLAPDQWENSFANNKFFVESKSINEQIGAGQINKLNEKALSLSSRYGIDLHVIIVSDFTDFSYSQSIEIFAEEISDGFQLGKSNEENSLLLVMSMNERDYDIYASGIKCNEIFNEYSRGLLEKAMLPFFKENNWSNGFTAYFDKCNELLELAQNGQIISKPPRNIPFEIIISILFGLIISAAIRAFVKSLYVSRIAEKHSAQEYVIKDSFKILGESDNFIHTTTSKTYSPVSTSSSSGSSSGGSRSSSHSSGKF